VTRQLRALSAGTWHRILELLGTGDFHRIEFRPPAAGDEEVMCDIACQKSGGKGSWWVCEADYMDVVTMPDGEVIGCDLVTRRFPFCLHQPSDE
jgi:hypothetical protein